jgi:hypothetical protein
VQLEEELKKVKFKAFQFYYFKELKSFIEAVREAPEVKPRATQASLDSVENRQW